ncbi:peptidoglycan-binding protein [Streptacidiphilus sp. N1-3]|uniref:Peptidoglycan-binding protein n=1 Tax=Streptacidiphilus alkalitolerans TaxID=3342712 RepID=A0ABV6X9G2_9ACTN
MKAQWRTLIDHVEAVPERIYENWNPHGGWDNDTQWGREFGENLVPWCVEWAWDEYHDAGFGSIVPKVDNVVVFSNWARSRGQWSEYPSIGAWTNFGNGHCELVVGFDAHTVYTKGGNSAKSGAVDNGQGNGVWSHSHPRRDAYVIGYFAPRFADGVCPPTADPADPRGGHPVGSWRWSPTASPTPPGGTSGSGTGSVSLANVIAAAKADRPAAQGSALHPADVLPVEKALAAEGLLAAGRVDGSYGSDTYAAYSAWQKAYSKLHGLGWTGEDVNGIPGRVSLQALGSKHQFTVKD